MKFALPELKYAYNALEPYIDENTMRIHHTKHHQAYLDNLNKALEGTQYAEWDIERIIRNLDELPENLLSAVRNNGGGYFNHSLFWEIMGPGGTGRPEGKLLGKINETFNSFEQFQEQFENAGKTQFGSGWAWLTVENGKLIIEKTPNQDSPLTNGRVPILCVDVWEHAYYLKYQNRRPEYLKNFWQVVNWHEVSKRFEKAMKR